LSFFFFKLISLK